MRGIGKVFFILLSVCVVCLPAYLWLYGEKKTYALTLTTLVQKTPTRTYLSPRFFSDYLALSPKGQKITLSLLDVKKIEKKLAAFPLFAHIEAKISNSGELILSYELREPRFFLGDFSDLGLDKGGRVIPLKPFFSPKILPCVWLGLHKIDWTRAYLIEKAVEVALFFEDTTYRNFQLESIDLSRLDHPITAHHEIIVKVLHFGNVHYLRIHPDRIAQALKRYAKIFDEDSLQNYSRSSFVFDARIKKFATLKVLGGESPVKPLSVIPVK